MSSDLNELQLQGVQNVTFWGESPCSTPLTSMPYSKLMMNDSKVELEEGEEDKWALGIIILEIFVGSDIVLLLETT